MIGAAHAGWRGARDGVLEATLDAMEALGADREPHPRRDRPDDQPEPPTRSAPSSSTASSTTIPPTRRFFAQGKGDRALFDLPAYGLHRLRAAGVGQAEWTRPLHLSATPTRFFSYRRTTHRGEADYGRLISAIRL